MDHTNHKHDMRSHDQHSMVESDNKTIEYLKFVGVITTIVVVSWLIFSQTDNAVMLDALRIFMGVFMLVFATFKLVGYKMFAMMFAGYDPIAKKSKIYAHLYPFIELALGVMALLSIGFIITNVTVVVLMGIGSVGVFQEIKKKDEGVHCACLGNVIKLPLSTVSLVEDLSMVALALTMLSIG